MSATKRELLTEAYERIGQLTPMDTDCGSLCGAICCQGEGGMLLFPGEADLVSGEPEFRLYRIPFRGVRVWWMTCGGACRREKRPLACRIFPLGPRINQDGIWEAVPDSRAKSFCPLADGNRLSPAFREAVGSVFRHLAKDPVMARFLTLLADELAELGFTNEKAANPGGLS